jgi:hypothetical protein
MKRTVFAIFLISIVIIAGAIWFILGQSENENQVEDQTFEVKIVDFKWRSNWGPGAGGVQWGRGFNITLQNLGNKAVEGLSVDVKLLVNNTELFSWTGLYGPGIIGYTAEFNGYDGKLDANETLELRGDFLSRLDVLHEANVWDEGQKAFFIITVTDDTILDELMLPFK